LKSEDDLTFSSEVAETLGIECSVILSLYNKNELNDVSSFQNLVSCIKESLPFINDQIINESVNKLIKYELIEFSSNSNNKNYEVKKPYGNKESNNMNNNWVPSIETMEILDMTDISSKFYKLKLKEFKVYWIERGQKKNNWNTTFIDFIRREWAKEVNSNKVLPHSINENWYPDDDVFDILNLSEISKDSALKYLKEFILYWKDKGVAFTTWNSKFIDHVKRRHMMNDNMVNNEENKKYSEPGKYTQDFKTRKNDNAWAKEINLE
jgi:hypothetical protein